MRPAFIGWFFVLVIVTCHCLAKTGSDAPQVEVKFEAQGTTPDNVLTQLTSGKEPREKRDVYFYDTPKLALAKHQLFLRARKTTFGDAPDDSTVKIRGESANEISDKWLHLEGANAKSGRKLQKDPERQHRRRRAIFHVP